MKRMPLRRSILGGFCVAACCLVAACNHKPKTPPPPIHSMVTSAPEDRLAWNMDTLVGAYEKAGHTNPKWDEAAKDVLTEFARFCSGTEDPGSDLSTTISNKTMAAVSLGCDDPMVQRLYLRFCRVKDLDAKELATAGCKNADALQDSSYPEIRKFYGWMRTAAQVRLAYGSDRTKIPQEVLDLDIWGHLETNILAVVKDSRIPPEEIYLSCHEILDAWKGNADYHPKLYKQIEDSLPSNVTSTPEFLLLKGEVYIDMAWQARGNGSANAIKPEAWQLFADRLAIAEETLTHAWELNPKDARIAERMIKVELGQGKGRPVMEMWFKRAMEVKPNDYIACNAKLYYLQPKWFGSPQDMLAFGRECVANHEWTGHVPLILLDAHADLQRMLPAGSDKDGYWSMPEVWVDLKSAFVRFFELNPGEISWYHNYAWYAYKAEDWQTLNAIIPKLGPVNYDYFGGRSKFNDMVAEAKAHAGPR